MRKTTCRKDIGLGASMSLSRKGTRPTASPSRRCFANTARNFWCAVGHSRRWKARRAAAYRSPEYAKAKALRAGAVDIDIIVIEGYDGPQPTD